MRVSVKLRVGVFKTLFMKTAMQELIDYIEEMYSKDDILEVIINKSNKLLEKEKEQIIKGYKAALMNPYYTDAVDYYNKNYNQNK